MIINRIVINNFRSFYGENIFNFNDDANKPVNVIFCENGVGKTNFLNSIYWCFHGDLTDSIKDSDSDDIVNITAVAKDDIQETSVCIDFSIDKNKFRITREQIDRNNTKNFKIEEILNGSIGETMDPSIIEQVLPKSMAKYFFFDGENTVNLFKETKNKENTLLREAFNSLIGSHAVKRTIDDLKQIEAEALKGIKNKLEKSSKDIDGKDVTSLLAEKLLHFTLTGETVQFLKDSIDDNNKKIEELDGDILDIQNDLSDNKDIADLLEEIGELKEKLKKDKVHEEEAKRDYYSWLSSVDSKSILSKNLISKIKPIIVKAKDYKSGVPSKWRKAEVEAIISSEPMTCICGRCIEENSDEYKNIKELVNQSSTEGDNDNFTNLSKLTEDLDKNYNKKNDEYNRLFNDYSYWKNEVKDTNEKIGYKNDLIGDSVSLTSIQELNNNRKEKEKAKDDENRDKGKNEILLTQRKKDFKNAKTDYEELSVKEPVIKAIEKKRKLISDLITNLEQKILDHETRIRKLLTSDIQEELKKYWKGYLNFQLGSDFKLTLSEDEIYEDFEFYKNLTDKQKKKNKSQGQSSLLAQTFIARLIKLCSGQFGESDFFISGISAPLVLDSPFGVLGPSYSVAAAKIVSISVPQVIYLGSAKQINEDVINTFGNKINSVIAIQGHLRESSPEAAEVKQDIFYYKDKQVPAFKFGQDFARVEIIKID